MFVPWHTCRGQRSTSWSRCCGLWRLNSRSETRVPPHWPPKKPYYTGFFFFFPFYLPIPYDTVVTPSTYPCDTVILYTIAIISLNKQLFQDKLEIRKVKYLLRRSSGDRCFGDWQRVLLFQRSRVWSPAPTSGGSQLPVTAALGGPVSSPGPPPTLYHVRIPTRRHTHIHVTKQNTWASIKYFLLLLLFLAPVPFLSS